MTWTNFYGEQNQKGASYFADSSGQRYEKQGAEAKDSREDFLLLEGMKLFFEDFTVDAVTFQVLKKSIIFEPRKATTEFGHATNKMRRTTSNCMLLPTGE